MRTENLRRLENNDDTGFHHPLESKFVYFKRRCCSNECEVHLAK